MKVSIITAAFNSSDTIKDTLQSIDAQSYNNIEHIIIDGLSTDNTIKIVERFKHNKIILSEKDNGIYDAMNKGIKKATGDIIGILNSDDLYVDNLVIKKIVNVFQEKKVDCVHAELYYVKKDNTNQIVRHWKSTDFIYGDFKKGWHPAHPTFFVRREIYEKYGLFNLNFQLAADFELMLRFLERYQITTAYLSEPIVRMRLGGATSKNIRNIIKQNFECYKAFKVNGIKVPSLYFLSRLLPKFKQFFHE
jgi:glycosyltransferase involved in cell wall biosynthesis